MLLSGDENVLKHAKPYPKMLKVLLRALMAVWCSPSIKSAGESDDTDLVEQKAAICKDSFRFLLKIASFSDNYAAMALKGMIVYVMMRSIFISQSVEQYSFYHPCTAEKTDKYSI